MKCVCGREYWANQAWIHKACVVVNDPVVVNAPVVNMECPVVVNARSGDRHNKEARRAYMREYMRRRRSA
jgi:hypothetical protein